MKVLMFGRGVIALDYGWALENAGNEIEFYVRPGKAAQYGPTVDLDMLDGRKSERGEKIIEKWAIKMREEVSSDHDFDLIFVSVNHQQLDEAIKKVSTFAGNATILFFNNLFGKLNEVSASLPQNQVIWGFPGAGGGFDGGILNGVLLKSLYLQSVDTAASAKRHKEIVSLFEGAGFAIDYQKDMEAWYWEHFIMDAAFAAQAGIEGGFNRVFSIEPMKQIILLMCEMLPLIQARGKELDENSMMMMQAPLDIVAEKILETFTKGSFLSKGADRLGNTSHTSPEILNYFCRDVLREARRLGVNTPLLEELEPNFKLDIV